MNRIDRLTGTLLLLQTRKNLTATAIADHWEISERTVYRDLAALCEAGVPLVFEPERGYRLLSHYHIPPVMFTESEALALFLSGEITLQVADSSLKEALRGALLKITSILPDAHRNDLDSLKQSLGIWLHTSGPDRNTHCLMPLQKAVLKRECIQLQYDTAGRGDVITRTVEPLAVLYYSGHWHLIGFCRLRQDFRDFRMDRVRQWKPSGERFNGHDDFSVEQFILEQDTANRNFLMTLLVQAETVEHLKNELVCIPVSETRLQDGRICLEVRGYSVEWTAKWLISYGCKVEVERPIELQLELKRVAKAIVDQYNKGDCHEQKP